MYKHLFFLLITYYFKYLYLKFLFVHFCLNIKWNLIMKNIYFHSYIYSFIIISIKALMKHLLHFINKMNAHFIINNNKTTEQPLSFSG